MLYFAPWKTALVLLVTLAGLVTAAPNLLSKQQLSAPPAWMQLPQINLGMVFGQPSLLPIFYTLYPGSIRDVSTLENVLQFLAEFGLTRVTFVMDKGFYSKSNLRHMDGMKFIIPLPIRCSVKSETVSSFQETIRSSEIAIRYRNYVSHCVRKPVTIAGKTYTGPEYSCHRSPHRTPRHLRPDDKYRS